MSVRALAQTILHTDLLKRGDVAELSIYMLMGMNKIISTELSQYSEVDKETCEDIVFNVFWNEDPTEDEIEVVSHLWFRKGNTEDVIHWHDDAQGDNTFTAYKYKNYINHSDQI